MRVAKPSSEGIAYVERALGVLGSAEPISTLRSLDVVLRRLLDTFFAGNAAMDRLRTPEAPGKWSVFDVVRHLAETELVYGYRLRMVLTIAEPVFERFDERSWARKFQPHSTDLSDALERLHTLRAWNLEVLEDLAPEDLERMGIHSKRGAESVRQMISLWAAHDLMHLQQIRRILGQVEAG